MTEERQIEEMGEEIMVGHACGRKLGSHESKAILLSHP